MHNFQNREILVFLALAEMAGFQSRPPSYSGSSKKRVSARIYMYMYMYRTVHLPWKAFFYCTVLCRQLHEVAASL
jgi:hypothetical protein